MTVQCKASKNHAHDDHGEEVEGIFQNRPSAGWKLVNKLVAEGFVKAGGAVFIFSSRLPLCSEDCCSHVRKQHACDDQRQNAGARPAAS